MSSHRFRVLSALPLALLAAACRGGAPDAPGNGAASAAEQTTSGGEVAPAVSPADSAAAAPTAGAPACAPDGGGITVPAGFCATVFADSVGGARHVAVAPNGDVFVALQTPRRRDADESGQTARGGILALRDRDGDGRAEARELFGDGGGTGIAVAPGWVYVDAGPRILRYPVPAGQLRPTGEPQVIVDGLPMGGHAAHSFALDGRGTLYVNVGSRSNACQVQDRQKGSPGASPCTELETRAGIWRYRADAQNQQFSAAERHATGIRNAVALTVAPDGSLWAAQHGRDQLFQNWPEHFDAQESAENPAEELLRVAAGDDFGWPYCYYDRGQRKRVLAPEYGGDGTQVGRCAQPKAPAATFPGHWAPMSVLFYTGRQFPARYRQGAFVAFHGSWNRAPLPQGGYLVAFVPLRDGRAAGEFETFADGFAGRAPLAQPSDARHRPVGLAQAPDGGVYVTDDVRGRIWKIVHTGR